MYILASYFTDFLRAIGLTEEQGEECKSSHKLIREQLMQDDNLKNIIVTPFIQGSYIRHTINKPSEGKQPDIDLVVVTRLSEEEFTPNAALDYFQPFLEEHYSEKYRKQGRSWGIQLENVSLDLVITSAPSEALLDLLSTLENPNESPKEKSFLIDIWENFIKSVSEPQWKQMPLRIPDREVNIWEDTHPLEQIKWTREKNAATNGHYIHVVRSIKWWRQLRESNYKRPKGYPLEHIIGFCCPNDINSVAEGVTLTFENIISEFQDNRTNFTTPFLTDHGADRNVLDRIDGQTFALFYDDAESASFMARKALETESIEEAVKLWRKLFGNLFPDYEGKKDNTSKLRNLASAEGYTPRKKKAEEVPGGRFA